MKGARRDLAAIVIVAAAFAAVLRPFQNTPFVDDWVYGWPVQHLLATGRFLFPEYLGNPIAGQVLWGALFCLPFGFSFAALRVSTWVLAVLAVCASYLLVREGGGTRPASLIAAAALGFYPIFFILAPTFMTDVPFLAATLWSAVWFVRALTGRRIALVWLAAAACAASVGTRVIGVGVAAAMIATLLFHTGRWGRRAAVLIPPALVVPFAGWLLLWTRARVFVSADMTWVPNSPQQRLANIRYAFDLLPGMLVQTFWFVLIVTGVALLPVAVGLLQRRMVRRAVAYGLLFGAGALVYSWTGFKLWLPFVPGQMWTLRDVGAAASFVPGWKPDASPLWLPPSAAALALASAAVLSAAWRGGALAEREKFLMWNIAAQGLIVATLWLTYDRCGLVFVPLVAALVLARQPSLSAARAAPGIVVFAAISLAGMHDSLAYNRAVWSAVSDLRARGVEPGDIDGGYVVNGWLQYVHPDQAHRDASGAIVIPMVNGFPELPYTIANQPDPARTVIRTYPYSGWLQPSGLVYVLQR
jgi:hypothetical protein